MSNSKIDGPGDIIKLLVLVCLLGFGGWVIIDPNASLSLSGWADLLDAIAGLAESI